MISFTARFSCFSTSLLLLINFIIGCGLQAVKRTLVLPEDIATVDDKLPFLKAHMHNGNVYVLNHPWHINPKEKTISSQASRLNPQRKSEFNDAITLSIDSVAIFETNRINPSPAIVAMALITGISAGITLYCRANPKACFGSCPTFYTGNNQASTLQAEGFSASITPALEASDIDALYHVTPTHRRFDLTMKNEALETHVVRYADLLTAPRPQNGRVFATSQSTFYQATNLTAPTHSFAPEGDCTPLLHTFDGQERFSPADSTNLATKETIELQFNTVPNGPLGLVIASRQTLLSTFVFYQSLAYLGHSAGAYLASLERNDPVAWQSFNALGNLLGGIEIGFKTPDGDFVPVDEMIESGPLATDIRIVPLPSEHTDSLTIFLRLTKGHYRIDHIALATLGQQVRPQRISPSVVYHNSKLDHDAHTALLDLTQTLTTLPGDVYTLSYDLPANFERQELFLESRGYYLEWMRQEWLAEENPMRVTQLLFDPAQALQDMAPEFKKMETHMEPIFWSSRYAH